MNYDGNRALELLRVGSGIETAGFRVGQEEAIRHLVEGNGKLLVVQKTGWGKSFVYFIAAKLVREAGGGPTLLISPLLSLMRNQIEAAKRMGVNAVAINSANSQDWDDIEAQLLSGKVDVLLIAPERLANEGFQERVLDRIASTVALLVIDEAHCVSDWGHDFRPDYRLIARMSQALPENFRLLGTTATANDRVMDDLTAVLGPNIGVSRGELSRPSLLLQTMAMPSQSERLAWLAERLEDIAGSGIIYALTVRDAVRVTEWLRSRGLNVECYTGRSDNREELEQALLENRVRALVATTALSMGFDKPDLAFVFHYQAPGSVVAYYQQVGRAGRQLEGAYGVLLSGEEDTEITDYFIDNAFPSEDEVNQVIDALSGESGGLSVVELEARVNLSRGRIDKTVKLLSLESPSPVVKQGSKWQLAAANLSGEFWERAERLTVLRHREQLEMQDYVALESGHMEFLVRTLDGEPECFQQPDLPPLSSDVKQSTLQEVIDFLRRTSVPIEPRRRWPGGGLPQYGAMGAIPLGCHAEVGRALCVWGDAGWGKMVRAGKYQDGRFSDELVAAAARSIREWNPELPPLWVTCIPSRLRPRLVPDFAERLAATLGLPFREVIMKTGDRQEQKGMANSVQQARNVDGSLAILGELLLRGPVLLVDDIVDSRWTMTVASWLLRSNGCGPVLPFAIATSAGG